MVLLLFDISAAASYENGTQEVHHLVISSLIRAACLFVCLLLVCSGAGSELDSESAFFLSHQLTIMNKPNCDAMGVPNLAGIESNGWLAGRPEVAIVCLFV